MERGAYRAELASKGNAPPLHGTLKNLAETEGETGLRRFFDEVCGGNPQTINRLKAAGQLLSCDLDLERKRQQHFPEFG